MLQKLKIDISKATKKIRTYRVKTDDIGSTYTALSEFGGTCEISYEKDSILIDVEETVTPVNLINYLHQKSIPAQRIDLIAESEKELKKTILK